MSFNESELSQIAAGTFCQVIPGGSVYYVDYVNASGAHVIEMTGKPALIRDRKKNEKAIVRHKRTHTVFAARTLVKVIPPDKLPMRLMDRRITMAKREAEGTSAVEEAPVAGATQARPSKERVTQIYTLTEKKPKESMKGQGLLVYETLVSLGNKANVAELTKAVTATGKLQTRQDAERVVGFYLSKFKRDGIATVEKVAEQPTAAETAAV